MKFSLKKPNKSQEDMQQGEDNAGAAKPKSSLSGLLSKPKGDKVKTRSTLTKSKTKGSKLTPKRKKSLSMLKSFGQK